MDDYELLDVGGGGRLERFGALVADRPQAAALDEPLDPDRWVDADLVFDRTAGWTGPGTEAAADGWTVAVAGLELELRPTDSGQVGVFPEHAAMVPWLRERVTQRVSANEGGTNVLHLFAYTGLVTLALAQAGSAVTHVDSAKPAVAWARRNAERNGLADRPVRWIVDDALAFTVREARRGRRYAGVVLDPPSYGHAADSRRAWRLGGDLPDLLDAIDAILDPTGFVLLTAHTEGIGPDDLAEALAPLAWGATRVDADELVLTAASGARLPLGAYARVDRA